MTFRLTIGIDPGLSGAVAFLDDGEAYLVVDMPVLTVGDWKEVDARELANRIRTECRNHPGAHVSACIEKVGARPTDGGTSAFRFGESSGKAKAVLEALGIPYARAIPSVWKHSFGLRKAEKDDSRQVALKRFPDMAKDLRRKKDDGRAEALLLALYHYNQEHTG